MKEQTPALTFPQLFDEYYGGIHVVAKSGFPFKCVKCGGTTYPGVNDKGNLVGMPVMKLEDMTKHVRKVHRERVIKKNGEAE